MTRTFIPRFLKAGGRLLPGARVSRLSQDGSKWRLQIRSDGRGVLAVEAETVFVCGGAVQTPALLRRSGLNRNVGNSLRLHPTVKLAARFPEPVNAEEMGVPVHQVKEFAPRLTFGCSISTPAYLALGLLDHPQAASEVRNSWRHLANYYASISCEGTGTIRAPAGFRDPLVRYQLSEKERSDLADGLSKLSDLLFHSGAAAIYPGVARIPPLLTRDDLKKLPAAIPNGLANLMTVHLFSSCPMGEDQTRCATDSFGRVHGFKNLFIADASLLCTAPGVNPQGTIMAIARRNALRFLDQSK